jgi:hypothetical protein
LLTTTDLVLATIPPRRARHHTTTYVLTILVESLLSKFGLNGSIVDVMAVENLPYIMNRTHIIRLLLKSDMHRGYMLGL